MRQIEQLHSLAVRRAGASTSKATAPQWQPPRCVTSGTASGAPAAGVSRREQARAVMPQLADRFVDIRVREVGPCLTKLSATVGAQRRASSFSVLTSRLR